jgi:hypothetical protein
VTCQEAADAEWRSQFCGCAPTAYEQIALVLYWISCPGAVVAGTVTGTVETGTAVVDDVEVGTAVFVRELVGLAEPAAARDAASLAVLAAP